MAVLEDMNDLEAGHDGFVKSLKPGMNAIACEKPRLSPWWITCDLHQSA